MFLNSGIDFISSNSRFASNGEFSIRSSPDDISRACPVVID